MSHNICASVFWSVDVFRCRGHVVFAYGWILSATDLPIEITLRPKECAQGQFDEARCGEPALAASLYQARPDVARSLPQYSHAARSGFLLYGALPSGVEEKQAWVLRVRWPGQEDSWLPLQTDASCSAPAFFQRMALQARQMGLWARRAWAIGRSAGWPTLIAKIKRRWRSHVASQGGRAQLTERLRELASRELAVIVDHDLGGGANLFRRKLTRDLLEKGNAVLLYFHDVSTLRSKVSVHWGDQTDSYVVQGFADVLDAVKQMAVRKVLYNTAASLPDAQEIPWGIVELRHNSAAQLIVYLHDYFCICPSQYLLNDQGVYCGVPDDPAQCRRCLRTNQQGFAALYPGAEVTRWRAAWGAMLMAADRVVAFSRASRDIVLRAFPALPKHRIEVVPHVVDHLPPRRVPIRRGDRLTVGIVGSIAYHKGAGVVRDLVLHVQRSGLPVRFVVIGTLEIPRPPGVLVETGPYRHEDLADHLQSHGVSIVLFPSIWPETFSYVVQELIHLGVPVAAFDIGAPAERLAVYCKALLLSERDPEQILQRLMAFWRTLPSDESEKS